MCRLPWVQTGPGRGPLQPWPRLLHLLWPSIGCSHDGHAPRRRSARGSGRSHRRRRGRHHQRGAGPRGPGHPGRRRVARPVGTAPRRRQGRDRDPQERGFAGRGCTLAGAPRHRPRAGGGGDGAVPRREDLDRPPDRRRLLLRLRVPRGRQAQRRGLRADRGRDAQARQGRRALHARGRAGGRGAGALPRRGPGLQGGADRGPGPRPGRRDRLPLHQRPLHRPVPGPARPVYQADQGLQADQRGRRLLARGRRPPDAHARVRHRVPVQGRPGGASGAP